MASSSPATPISRRSISLPSPQSASGPDPQIEVLYHHPSARIISFTTSNPTSQSSPITSSPGGEEEPGSLSWISRFERTIAVGMYPAAPFALTRGLLLNRRSFTHISSSRLCSIFELFESSPAHTTKITMLGSGWVGKVRLTDKAASILAHRSTQQER
jgi:hypothetical protein